MGSSLSRALAAVRGQERRRPVQMAVGVMNAKFRRAFERRAIMSTWGSMLPESRLAVRFVQRCRSCNQTKQRSCVQVVCVDEETEHQKAIAWFRLALDLFPRAQWICHSDDDVYLQARQVRRQAGSPNLKCCVPKPRVYVPHHLICWHLAGVRRAVIAHAVARSLRAGEHDETVAQERPVQKPVLWPS